MKPIAYSYTRISTAQQVLGDGERRQIASAEAYAKAHGLELDTSMRDLGLSGYKGTHRTKGAMGEFVKAIKASKIVPGSTLIVEDVDRLSRERTMKALDLFTTILDAGISIHTTRDGKTYTPTDYDRLANLLPLILYVDGAHQYSEKLSMRVSAARESARREARESGKPITARCPSWLVINADRTGFNTIPDRVQIVRRIYDMAIAGAGSDAIARRLNTEAVPVISGARYWVDTFVRTILTARTVMGEYVSGDGNNIPGYYPAIISADVFQAVQEARRANKRGGGKRSADGKITNLFSSMVTCAVCGGKMVYNDNGKLARLYCKAAMSKGGCSVTGGVNYTKLEGAVISRLGWMDSQGLLNQPAPQHGGEIELEISRLTLAIEAGEAALKAWMGQDVSPRIKRLAKEKEAELDQLEAAREAAEAKLAELRPTVTKEDHAAALMALKDAAASGDQDARLRVRTALRSLITGIACDATEKACTVKLAGERYGFVIDMETGEAIGFEAGTDGGMRLTLDRNGKTHTVDLAGDGKPRRVKPLRAATMAD